MKREPQKGGRIYRDGGRDGLFMGYMDGRAFIEGKILERVDRDGGCLVSCCGAKIQFQFNGRRPLAQVGQLIQACGHYEPETPDEYAMLTVETFGLLPVGWTNG